MTLPVRDLRRRLVHSSKLDAFRATKQLIVRQPNLRGARRVEIESRQSHRRRARVAIERTRARIARTTLASVKLCIPASREPASSRFTLTSRRASCVLSSVFSSSFLSGQRGVGAWCS
jgi:hypothetical protein